MVQHAVYPHLAGLTNAVDVTDTSTWTGDSLAQSSEQAPFNSKFVGSILATDSCEMSQSTLCRKSWVFSGSYGFLPQGKLTGWVRINIVRKVMSQLL
jgi:hypothetical protein